MEFKLWLESSSQSISIAEWADQKWIVLAALFNAAGILGRGFIAKDHMGQIMTVNQAHRLYNERIYKSADIKHKWLSQRNEAWNPLSWFSKKQQDIPNKTPGKDYGSIWEGMEQDLKQELISNPDFEIDSWKFNKMLMDKYRNFSLVSDFMQANGRQMFYFDYVGGKPIKVNLHPFKTHISAGDAYMYSNRNSPEGNVNSGFCAMVIDTLRRTKTPDSAFMSALGSAQTDMNWDKLSGSKSSPKSDRF